MRKIISNNQIKELIINPRYGNIVDYENLLLQGVNVRYMTHKEVKKDKGQI